MRDATLFAVGIVIISRSHDISIDLTHILFGSIVTVNNADLVRDAVLGGGCLVVVAVLFRDLRDATFDP